MNEINSGRELVESGRIGGRAYRAYSDGTYKAASSKGWLSFRNREELERFCDRRRQERIAAEAKQYRSGSIIARLLDALKR